MASPPVTGAHQAPNQPQLFLSRGAELVAMATLSPFTAVSCPYCTGSWELPGCTVWEPYSLLFMEGLIRNSKQNPGTQRPNSASGTTTSSKVKVICNILLQRFKPTSPVCCIAYSIFMGMRCSCTGLWADTSGSVHVHANIHTFLLVVSPSLVLFNSVD